MSKGYWPPPLKFETDIPREVCGFAIKDIFFKILRVFFGYKGHFKP